MNRKMFLQEFQKACCNLDRKRMKYLIKKSIVESECNKKLMKENINLVIVMEELAELSQEISKYIRGMEDHHCLIEEMGDVMLGLEYVKQICGIETLDIYRAMNVKLKRLEDGWKSASDE